MVSEQTDWNIRVKILILDIETAPKVAYVWRFFKENIGAKQVLEHGHILSFAAKWLGVDEVHYEENRKENDKKIIRSLVRLLDEADIIVAHNGAKFDLPSIAGRALVHGIHPPSPFKIVDTCLVARKEFMFPSNSLEYLCKVLEVKNAKKSHKKFPGFELWLACLRNDEEAWAEMKEYNIYDILALEEIYIKMRPHMKFHPNVAIYNIEERDEESCPKCGSHNLQKRGFAHTNLGRYQRYQCQDCGGWSRGRSNVLTKEQRSLLVSNG